MIKGFHILLRTAADPRTSAGLLVKVVKGFGSTATLEKAVEL